MRSFNGNPVPSAGDVIAVREGKFVVPDHPIVLSSKRRDRAGHMEGLPARV